MTATRRVPIILLCATACAADQALRSVFASGPAGYTEPGLLFRSLAAGPQAKCAWRTPRGVASCEAGRVHG